MSWVGKKSCDHIWCDSGARITGSSVTCSFRSHQFSIPKPCEGTWSWQWAVPIFKNRIIKSGVKSPHHAEMQLCSMCAYITTLFMVYDILWCTLTHSDRQLSDEQWICRFGFVMAWIGSIYQQVSFIFNLLPPWGQTKEALTSDIRSQCLVVFFQ